jgi:fructose-1,6-bisphosphatase/inositol monophosphatase family enzyme
MPIPNTRLLGKLKDRGLVSLEASAAGAPTWSGWGRVQSPFIGGHLKALRGELTQKEVSVGKREGQNSDVAKIENGLTVLSPVQLLEHLGRIAARSKSFDPESALDALFPSPPSDDENARLLVAAATAALAAGEWLKDQSAPAALLSGEDKSVRTQADVEAQRRVEEALVACGCEIGQGKEAHLPPMAKQMLRALADHPGGAHWKMSLFGEEQADVAGVSESLVAIVDPCDGTTNYVAGIETYCVGVAICSRKQNGAPHELVPLCSAVFHPTRGELFVGIVGCGGMVIDTARREASVMHPQPNAVLGDAVVASHLTSRTEAMLHFVNAPLPQLCTAVRRVLMFGSGLLQLAWVASGRLDAFLQPVAGGSWDIIPGAILVQAAGGAVTACSHPFAKGSAMNLTCTSVLAAGNAGLHRNLATVVQIAESFPMRK